MGLTDTVFGWLRRGACQAVLSGVADACDQIAGDAPADDDTPLRLAGLRARLAALPAPDATEADAPRTRKGVSRG